MASFKSVILVVFLFLDVSLVFAQDLVSSFDALVQNYSRRQSFQGNVLVRVKGETIYTKSVGLAHIETKTPHTIDSKFMVASITKSFTAAAVLKLVDEGLLSLDDSINKYIPLTKTSKISPLMWEAVTIKQLLNHTSGLIRDFKESAYLSRSDYNTLQAILNKALEEESTLFFEAGEKHYYSNFGYLLLAAVVDKVGKGTYSNFVRAKLLLPNKIHQTGEYHRREIIENMADGYFFDSSHRLKKRCCDDATSLTGAASMYSTVKDLSLWVNFLANEKLSNNQTFFEAMMSQTVQSLDNVVYGFGMMKDSVENKERFFHTGHEFGYMSSMSYVPAEEIEVIVLSNKHGSLRFNNANNSEELAKDILSLLIK